MLYTCPILSCPVSSYCVLYLSRLVLCCLTTFYVPSCSTCLTTCLSYCAVYLLPSCPVLPAYLTVLYTCPCSALPVLSYLPILLCCIPVPSCPVLPAYLTVPHTCPRLDNTTLYLVPHLVRAQDAYKDVIILPILDLYHTASISPLRPSLTVACLVLSYQLKAESVKCLKIER